MTLFPTVHALFDPATFTLTYVVYDQSTRDAVIVDPVLDFDPAAARTSTASAERLVAFVEERGLHVHWILETHAHADHLTAADWLKRRLPGAKVAIGERIREVQKVFRDVLSLPDTFPTDGSQFDALLADGESLAAGSLVARTIATPGHTPACVTFAIGDALFTGDALFMEDYGTGRCDFPHGSADELYTSVHDRLYALPDATRIFVGHDYLPGGRALAYETTIGASKRQNVQLASSTTREEFVARRNARDASLAAPRLLYPSVQVNIDGGRLPAASSNGVRYLRIPLDLASPEREPVHPAER